MIREKMLINLLESGTIACGIDSIRLYGPVYWHLVPNKAPGCVIGIDTSVRLAFPGSSL